MYMQKEKKCRVRCCAKASSYCLARASIKWKPGTLRLERNRVAKYRINQNHQKISVAAKSSYEVNNHASGGQRGRPSWARRHKAPLSTCWYMARIVRNKPALRSSALGIL
jgi:hypothetical protein